MFYQNLRKAIAIVLVVSMTIGTNGFYTLAEGIDDTYSEVIADSISEKNKDYYADYTEERYEKTTVFKGNTLNGELIDEEYEDVPEDDIVFDNETPVENEANNLEDNDTASNEKLGSDGTSLDFDVVSPDMDDKIEKTSDEYVDEPEEDEEKTEKEATDSEKENETSETATEVEVESSETETEIEAETEIEVETETETVAEVVETEESVEEKVDVASESEVVITDVEIEINENEEKIATTSEVEEIEEATKSELSDEEYLKSIATESDIDLIKSTESNVKIKTITRYIKSTKSVASKSQWQIREVLIKDQVGSIITDQSLNGYEGLFADTVKVLLVDQFGNEKVIRVKADWKFETIGYSMPDSEETLDRLEREFEEVNKNNDIKINLDEVDVASVTTDKNLSADSNKDKEETNNLEWVGEVVDSNKLEDEIVSVKSNKLGKMEDSDETIKEEVENSLNDYSIDNVKYEYVDVYVEDEPILANDLDKEMENGIVGNASSTFVKPDKAKFEVQAVLDKEKLLKNVAMVLALEMNKQNDEEKEDFKSEKIVNSTKEEKETREENEIDADIVENKNENISVEESIEEFEPSVEEETLKKNIGEDYEDEPEEIYDDEDVKSTVMGLTGTFTDLPEISDEETEDMDLDINEDNNNIDLNNNENEENIDTDNQDEASVSFEDDFVLPRTRLLGAGASHTYTSHYECGQAGCIGHKAGIEKHTASINYNKNWATAQIKDRTTYSEATNLYLATNVVEIDAEIAFLKDVNLCLNGNELRFRPNGVINAYGSLTICNCNSTGSIKGYNTKLTDSDSANQYVDFTKAKKDGKYRRSEKHIDPATGETVEGQGTSAVFRVINDVPSGASPNRKIGVFKIGVSNIMSILPNENGGEFQGSEIDSAAFIYVVEAAKKAIYDIEISDVVAEDLWGTRGGFINAHSVRKFNMAQTTFARCMAYKGACVNIKFSPDINNAVLKLDGNSIGLNNTAKRSSVNFKNGEHSGLDWTKNADDTESSLGYGYRPDHIEMEKYEAPYLGGNSFAHIYKKSDTYEKYTEEKDSSGKLVGKKVSSGYYDVLQSLISPYAENVPNGLLSFENLGLSTDVNVSGNSFSYNNTYDNCGVLSICYTKTAQTGKTININNNTFIENKDIYKASKNVKSGVGLTINVLDSTRTKYIDDVIEGAEKDNADISVNFFANEIDGNESKGKASIISFANIKGVNVNSFEKAEDKAKNDKKVYKNNISANEGGVFNFVNVKQIDIQDVDFENNYSAYKGGAINIEDSDEVIIGNPKNEEMGFSKNVSHSHGGAISMENAKFASVSNAIFERNAVASGYQYISILDKAQVDSLKILSINNMDYSMYKNYSGAYGKTEEYVGSGGAISFMASSDLGNDASLNITDTDFIENEASATGGAIYMETEGGLLNIIGTTSQMTKPTFPGKIPIASRSDFKKNKTGKSGGAIMLNNTGVKINGINFETNKAEQGGAIFTTTHDKNSKVTSETTKVEIKNTLFDGNTYITDDDMPLYYQEEDRNRGGSIRTREGGKYIFSSGGRYNRTLTDYVDNAGGAIYSFQTKIKIDRGTYLTRNYNTFYSIGGEVRLERLTDNHDLIDTKEDDIVFENNIGNYILGHGRTFKTDFYLLGGQIINNTLNEYVYSAKNYTWYDYELSRFNDKNTHIKNSYAYYVGGKVGFEDLSFTTRYYDYSGAKTGNVGKYFYDINTKRTDNRLSTSPIKAYDSNKPADSVLPQLGWILGKKDSGLTWLQLRNPKRTPQYKSELEGADDRLADDTVYEMFNMNTLEMEYYYFNPYLFNYDPDGYVRGTADYYTAENPINSRFVSQYYYRIKYTNWAEIEDKIDKATATTGAVDFGTLEFKIRPINSDAGYENTVDYIGGENDAHIGQNEYTEYIVNIIKQAMNKKYNVTNVSLNDSYQADAIGMYFAGNMTVIKNRRKNLDIEQNIPLEEAAATKLYKISLMKEEKLHINAQLGFTPEDSSKASYQLFGEGFETTGNNQGLYNDDWIEGLGDGDVPSSMFINARKDDPNDSRVIYINNVEGTGHYEIMLEDPSLLLTFKFEMFDKAENGESRLSKSLDNQYIKYGTTLYNPIGEKTQVYTTNSDARLVDLMGYQTLIDDKDDPAKRFIKFDFSKKVYPEDISDNDKYEQKTIYAIYSRLDRPHKICGLGPNEECNHSNGVKHTEIYGKYDSINDELTNQKKVIEVTTISQLLYARWHPEYFYELQRDIILPDTIWNRPTNGILNDANNPINNLKLCLNGHSLTISGKTVGKASLFNVAGEYCYIVNCKNKNGVITYKKLEGVTYPKENITINESSGVNTKINIIGRDSTNNTITLDTVDKKEGYIVFDNMRTYTDKQNLINLRKNNDLLVENVRFDDTDKGDGIRGSILDVSGSAYLKNIIINNIKHTLSRTPGITEDSSGQGIFRFTDGGTAVTQVVDGLITKNSSVNRVRTAIIDTFLSNESSSITIQNSIFDTNNVMDSGVIYVNSEISGYKGKFNLLKSTISNTNIAKGLNDVNGVGVRAKNMLNKFVVDGNTFDSNGLKNVASISSTAKVRGGAIALYSGNVNLIENDIVISNNKFKNNMSDLGGALYLSSVQKTTMEGNTFESNAAYYGSAIYHIDSSTNNVGNKTITKNSFIKNGYADSKGTYYLQSVSNRSLEVNFNGITATENIGKGSFLYADYVTINVPIIFSGVNTLERNTGGPVILSTTESNRIEHNPTIYFTGENYIKNNTVGDSYAIYTGSRQTRFAISGIIDVRFNKDVDDKDANFAIMTSTNWDYAKNDDNLPFILGRDGNGKIIASKSYISFTKEKSTSNADNEVSLFKWTKETIEGFGLPYLMSQEHFFLDDRAENKGVVVYKAENDYLAIGYEKNARKLVANSSEKLVSEQFMYVKYGVSSYLDNFGEPKKDEGYEEYTYKGWIAEREDETFVAWDFMEDKFKNIKGKNQSVDAIWATAHGHKICGTKTNETCVGHPSHENAEEWIIAFNNRFFNTNMTWKFMLTADIVMEEVISEPEAGYAICLNGHTMTKVSKGNLVSITKANGSFSIVNCKEEGGLIASDLDSNGEQIKAESLFIVAEGEDTDGDKNINVNIYNVNIDYAGSRLAASDGLLVSVKNVNLAIDGMKLSGSVDVSSSLIYAKNSQVLTLNRFDIQDKTLEVFGDTSIVYLDNCYSSNAYTYDGKSYSGLMMVNNNIKNVEMKREKGFYYFDNFKNDINVIGGSIDGINNLPETGYGSVFNIKNAVGNINFASTSIANNKGNNGSVLYLDYNSTDDSTSFTINMLKSIFDGNISQNNAALINADLNEVKSEDYKLVVNVYDNVSILNNKSEAGNGGAILIKKDTDKLTKNEFNVIGKNVVFKRNNAAGGAGGFAYLTDTIYVESENVMMDGNKSNAEGGALYLNRVRSTHRGYYRNNNSYGEGAAIYLHGASVGEEREQYRDSITFGKSSDSKESDDNNYFFYAYNNISIHKNYAKHGVVTIGAYANMYFAGKIIMRGAKVDAQGIPAVPDAIDEKDAFDNYDDYANSLNDIVILYLKTDITTPKGEKFGYEDANVERKIVDEYFDYENSRIHSTSDYYNEKVITHYTKQLEYAFNERFFADQKEKVNRQTGLKEPNNVYFTGTNKEAVIHVGVQSRPVYFVLDGGRPVDSYGHTAINPDKIGASGGVKLPKVDEVPEVIRDGYTFKGWVTSVYQEEAPYFKMGSLNLKEDMIYVEADKEYLNIYAVWENNSTGRIEVNYFEQLYYDGTNRKFDLMKDIYDYSKFEEINELNDGGELFARRVGTKDDQLESYTYSQAINVAELNMNGHSITRTSAKGKLFDGSSIKVVGSEDDTIAKFIYENPQGVLYNETFINAQSVDIKNISFEGFKVDIEKTKFEKALISVGQSATIDTVTFTNNQDMRIDLTVTNNSEFKNVKFTNNKTMAPSTTTVSGNRSMLNILSLRSLVKFEEFEITNNEIDAIFSVGSATGGGQFVMTNGAISSNKVFNKEGISYVLNSNNSKVVELSDVRIKDNNDYERMFILDATTFKLSNTQIETNNIRKKLISVSNTAIGDDKAFEFRNVKISQNIILDDITVGELIEVAYRDGKQNSILEDVNIINNVTSASLKFYDTWGEVREPQVSMGGLVYIYENRDTNRNNTNFFMKPYDETGSYVDFIPGKVLASTSMIGVNINNVQSYVGKSITNNWVDSAHLSDRTTYNVFTLDVTEGCILYKDGTKIKIGKPNENNLTVAFDLMDEKVKKVVANQRVSEGSIVDLMADPISNEGHKFLGWYYDKGFETKYEFGDSSSTKIDSEHTTIYALWDRIVTVTVNANDGGYSASDRRVLLPAVEAPTTWKYETKMGSPLNKDVEGNDVEEHIFKREGLYPSALYTQNGFNQGKNDKPWGEEWKFNTTRAGRDTTLYVKWLGATISIAFSPDWIGGDPSTYVSGSDKIVTHYDSILTDELPVVEKVGYTFKGWHTSTTSMVSATQLTNRMAVTYREDVVAYANWVPAKYTVSFTSEKLNENSKMSNQVIEYGKKVSLKANELKYTGNKLKYWARYDEAGSEIATYSDCEEVLNLSTGDDVVLYAIWEADKFEITLNLNDTVGSTRATVSTPVIYVEYGKELGNIPEPTRKGYTFEGWYKTNKFLETDIVDATTTYDWTGLIKLGVVQNSTLYAKWTKNKYKVTFDANLDNVEGIMDDLDAEFDKKITVPKNLYKASGYTYLGLVSKVKLLVEGVEKEKEFNYDNTAKLTIDQYDNFGYADGIEDGATITLRASWSEHKYVVEYNANLPEGTKILNGVEKIASASHMYSDNWTLSTDMPTKYEIDGYEFIGFTDTKDGKSPKVEFGYDNTKPPASYGANTNNGYYVLYAQWVKNPYYIDFLPGGEDVTEEGYTVQGTMSRQKLEVDKATNLHNVNTSGNGFTFKGHKFAYWEDQETKATYSNTQEVVNVRTVKDAVAQFKAIWTEYTYSIDYDYNPPTTGAEEGNTIVGEKKGFENIKYGETINIGTASVSLKGYEFDSFITPDKKTTIKAGDNVSRLAGVNGNGDVITLKYKWNNKTYKVRFDKNLQGSSQGVDESTWIDSKIYTYDKTFQKGDTSSDEIKGLPNGVVRPGFKFGGWTIEPKTPMDTLLSSDYVKNTFLFRYSDVVEGDDIVLVLYAHWKPLAYTVTLSANSVNGSVGAQDGSFKDLGAIVTNTMKLSNKQFDQPIGQLATPNLAGYKFKHYTKDAAGSGDVVSADTLIWPDGTNTRHTIYAQYEPITYSVKFEKGNDDVEGSVPAMNNIKYGDTITLPNITETDTATTFKRKGYTFAGWSYKDKPRQFNKNSNIKDLYANNAQVSNIAEIDGQEVVLVAEWTAHKYSVVFNQNAPTSNSGESNEVLGSMTNQDMTYEVAKTLTTNKYSLSGYTFKGWNTKLEGDGTHYDDAAEVSTLSGSGYGSSADNTTITLYAEWEPIEYTVSYSVNDKNTTGMGSTVAKLIRVSDNTEVSNISFTTKYDQKFDLTELNKYKAERIGYEFLGWGLKQDVLFDERPNSIINANSVYRTVGNGNVYAMWKNNKYSVSFDVRTRSFRETDNVPDIPAKDVWFDLPYGKVEGISTSVDLPVPEVLNYQFGSWVLSSWDSNTVPTPADNLKVSNTTPLYNFTENTTLKAWWQGSLNKVTLNANGGKVYDKSGSKTMVDSIETKGMLNVELNTTGYIPNGAVSVRLGDGLHYEIENKGYTFEGWYTNDTDEGKYVDASNQPIKVTGSTRFWTDQYDVTLYAKWSPVQFRFDYDQNLPSGKSASEITWERNATTTYFSFGAPYTTELSVPSLSGYTFLGWNTVKEGNSGKYLKDEGWSISTNEEWDKLIQSSNMTFKVYARWDARNVRITWDANKGNGSTNPVLSGTTEQTLEKEYRYGAAIGQTPIVRRDGYTFDGWFTVKGTEAQEHNYDPSSWKNQILDNTVVNFNGDSITAYAKWVPDEIIINFNANDSSSSTRAVLGYASRKVMFDDKLDEQRTASFIKSGVPTQAIPAGLPTATMDGYEFKGWFEKQDGTGVQFENNSNFSIKPTGRNKEVTVYAKWEAKEYTLNFDENDGTKGYGSTNVDGSADNKNIIYDSYVTELPELTRSGYNFMGWWTKDGWNNGNVDAGDWGVRVITGIRFTTGNVGFNANETNINLYARWDRKEITIVYNGNAGDTVITFNNGVIDTKATRYEDKGYYDLKLNQNKNLTDKLAVIPFRNGYTFEGWSLESGIDIDVSTYTIDSAVSGDRLVLSAKWAVKQYELVFDANYLDSMKPVNRTDSRQTSLPHSAEAGEVDEPTVSNTGTYTISQGSQFESYSGVEAKIISKNPNFADQEGYTFKGWSIRKDGTTGLLGTSVTFNDELYSKADNIDERNSKITLYAQWDQKEYNIAFNKNIEVTGITVTTETMDSLSAVKFNELKTLPANGFSQSGFEFVGWDTEQIRNYNNPTPKYPANINGTIINPQVARLGTSGTITLYAVWRVKTYNITYVNESVKTGNRTAMNMNVNIDLPTWYNITGQRDRDKTIQTPFRQGYEFLWWKLPNGATMSQVVVRSGELIDPSGDVVIAAVWNANSYDISFEGNGGVGPNGETSFNAELITDEDYSIPDFGFKRTNMIISHWNTDPNGNGKSLTVRQTINIKTFFANIDDYEAQILYAIWTDTTAGRAVTVSNRGGGGGGGGGGGRGGGGAGIAASTNGLGFNATTLTQSGGLTQDASGAAAGNWNYDPTSNKWTYTLSSGDVSTAGGSGVGNVASNGWYKIPAGNGWYGWYSFDNTGNMRTGLYTDTTNGNTYYLNTTGLTIGQMATGWVALAGKEYFFDLSSGVLQKGAVTPDGYITDATGAKAGIADYNQRVNAGVSTQDYKGRAVEGVWNYDAGSNSWNLQLANVDSNQSYTARNEWVNIMYNGQRQSYRFNEYGVMQTGLVTDTDGNVYYLDESNTRGRGAMKAGVVSIGGVLYYFNQQNTATLPYGALAKNATLPDGKHTDATGRIID